jgi:Ni,Fe-hydrogenase III large subunit
MMEIAAFIRAAQKEELRLYPRFLLSAEEWQAMSAALAKTLHPALLALWAESDRVHALLQDENGDLLPVASPIVNGAYAALSPARPAAIWFERVIRDLWGHSAEGGRDHQTWLDHGTWAIEAPLSRRPKARLGEELPREFAAPEEEDVHQFALGPISGGIAKPFHLRITMHGDVPLTAEFYMGYAHKGVMALMRGKLPRVAARCAARLSGDATVAHALAYAHAVEAALGVQVPARAIALRAIMAELERIAHHLFQIGVIADTAKFGILHAGCGSTLEELRASTARAFGHRLMMDCIVPGGLAADIAADGQATVLGMLDALQGQVSDLAALSFSEPPFLARLQGIGRLSEQLVREFAPGGPIGRTYGSHFDARRRPGYPPYDSLEMPLPQAASPDAAGYLRVLFAELRTSMDLARRLLEHLPDGEISAPLPVSSGEGLGVAEAPRGDVWHWVRLDGGMIAASFAADPSWRHWPLLEAALVGEAMEDLPLCLACFHCSVSAVDL